MTTRTGAASPHHRHGLSGKNQTLMSTDPEHDHPVDVSTDITAALDAHVAKYHATTPPTSGETMTTFFSL